MRNHDGTPFTWRDWTAMAICYALVYVPLFALLYLVAISGEKLP